jgi:hypothetical protein
MFAIAPFAGLAIALGFILAVVDPTVLSALAAR